MKKCFLRALLAGAFLSICAAAVEAQIFTGTNAPGQGTNFVFTVPGGTTNLSLSVLNNSTAYSYLLVKRGGAPTDTDYDFSARLPGQNNTLSLETPELAATNYGLRVSTPAASARHPFAVVLTANLPGMRSAAYPVVKPLVFSTSSQTGTNGWSYYQVEALTNLPGWRLVVSSTNPTAPALYVRRGALPTSGVYDKTGYGQNPATVTYGAGEAVAGTYFIGVYQPGGVAGVDYQLGAEVGATADLGWDLGLTHEGTAAYTNASPLGGNYFFRALPQATVAGGWRVALKVISGEASVYARQGVFDPNPASYTVMRSERPGSDGFVVHSSQYTAGQTWHLCVAATPGAQWTLLSGEAYVLRLGALPGARDAAGVTNVEIGPEGMRFFQTTPAADTLAWRLGLAGATNDLLVKKGVIPLPLNTSTYDRRQPGQMLVVPSYLTGGDVYCVGVAGAPGERIALESRQQEILDAAFLSTNTAAAGPSGYVTYRLSVPVQQMAWFLAVTPLAGEANLCVRRDYVPNEWNNDAYSEVAGSTTDSLSLVPPTLSDGTFFVTVYGSSNFTALLASGKPAVTEVEYVSTSVNNDPARVGWRYYQVADILAQLGSLGWELFLESQPPGTEIALRRNSVPGRWNYRQNNLPAVNTKGYVDYSSVAGFLQRPGHQADVWYVGVYNPTNALGNFVLNLREMTGTPVSFNGAGSAAAVSGQASGRFNYFRIEVPPGALGWDLRLTNVTSGSPRLIVRRDLLPDSLATTPGWTPATDTNWLNGRQWAAADDWTDLPRNNAGVLEDGRILACGMANPLTPGVYYAGVINAAGDLLPMSYSLASRGIGPGYSIPVTPLAFSNGVAWISNLPPREAAYFQVTVPPGCDSWKTRLSTNSGEALLMVQKDALPSVAAGALSPLTFSGGRWVQKAGDEEYTLMQPGTNGPLPAGTYYLAVAGEGQNPDRVQGRAGGGTTTASLRSLGTLAPVALGTLGETGLAVDATWAAGETWACRFTVPAGVMALEVWIDNRAGNPRMALRPDLLYPQPVDRYGNDGGAAPLVANDRLIQLANPAPGDYTVLIHASASNAVYLAASGTVRVRRLTGTPLAFDGGMFAANGVHPAGTWRYYGVTVPPGALGWDLRLTNATSGDPRLVLRKDLAPDSLTTLGTPWSSKTWPSNAQWAAGLDWTGYQLDADGTNRYGQVLQLGMGNPLEPGEYVVGVAGAPGNTNELRYTLVSRGIGTGFMIPVTPLEFTNGTIALSNLPPREAAYFSVVAPTNLTSWSVRVATNGGDVLLCVQKDALPNVAAGTVAPQILSGGRKVQKAGSEQYTLLTGAGQSNVAAGTYYLAVVSEGVSPGVPNALRLGAGPSSATVQSYGPMPRVDLGQVLPGADVALPETLDGGAARQYQFVVMPGTMSLEVSLDNRTANPRMSLRADPLIPMPAGVYGSDGGAPRTWQADTQITIPNPATGLYTLVVQADYTGPGALNLSVYSNATYTVRIHAAGALPVSFVQDVVTVTDHQPGTWRHYLVTNISAAALGWDVRLTNVTSGDPRLVIRRDQPPTSLVSGGSLWTLKQWPSNGQWAAGLDWTGYSADADGTNRNGHILAMGMGNPLEPGVYYIGVFNGTTVGTGANVMKYTLVSRAIGEGFPIPVVPLAFTNSQAAVTNLAPREAAYFSVVVPSNTLSWQMRLGASVGESLLCVQKDALPSVAAGAGAPQVLSGGRKIQKAGDEQYLLMPAAGQSNLIAGTYYVAVVSEGWNPGKSALVSIGTNVVAASLQSIGPAPVRDLGWIAPGTDLTLSDAAEGGGVKLYQFMTAPGTLSTEIWMLNRQANPKMSVRADAQFPVLSGTYGNDGGQTRLAAQDTIVVPNPTNIFFTLAVQADFTGPGTAGLSVYSNATYTLWLRALGSLPLVFDGGTAAVTDQMPSTWRFFQVRNVPEHALGWDIRLTNVTGGDPRLVLRRGAQPDNTTTHAAAGGGWTPQTSTNWPVGCQWAAATDWTGCSYDAAGTSQVGRVLQMGMGNPLEPGSYYIGIYNNSATTVARYAVALRGIGDGYALPVTPLEFNGGAGRDASLPVREAAYYAVDVPSNAPSWKIRLAATAGETLLMVQKDRLPNVAGTTTTPGQLGGGFRLSKAGSEHFVLLPQSGLSALAAGRYYLLAASQGLFPDLPGGRTGAGGSSSSLTSQGVLPVEDLGPLPAEGVTRSGSLEGGELRAYRFSLPAGLPGLVARLDNRSGNPWMSLRRGDAIPAPYYDYGYNGGMTYEWQHDRFVTLANARSTNYALIVQASQSAGAFPNAGYLLRLRPPPVAPLAFDPLLEGGGTNAAVCAVLVDGERTFYRVEVPWLMPDGAPASGWRLALATAYGQSSVRVRKDLLPADDYAGAGQTAFVTQQAVIVAPLLTPGVWYVEVSAAGATSFCLSSAMVRPVRPEWVMPAEGRPVTTPGLTNGPFFGDTGVDPQGVERSGDGGLDMEQGNVHFYEVSVPEGNGGVLRTVLEAINGNPDMYLRLADPPTFTHRADGRAGSVYDRSLTGNTTEYGNWVPVNGKSDKALAPGRYYIAVRASGTSNCRYRLRLSTGSVTDLPLNGSATAQVMAAGDWRYYRFMMPTNAPVSWTVGFQQQVGDVVMYVRDTIPPGHGASVGDYYEWARDGRNHGPYPNYDPPGNYTFNTPPLRPGTPYYIGFRAVSDSTFSITSATNSVALNLTNFLSFYGGYVTNILPAYGCQVFRIDVPPDASRWRHTSAGPATVRFHLDQGSPATVTSSDHSVTTGNAVLDRFLRDPAGWPWAPGQMYFLAVTNTTATPQGFSFRIDGRNCLTDDSDGDGLSDCWEMAFWPAVAAFAAGDDPDHDGVDNRTESLDGTDPTDPTSLFARLTLAAQGSGSVTPSPLLPAYYYGTPVTLTATPAPGNVFLGWSGLGVSGKDNPLTLVLTTNRLVVALFDTDYGAAASARADYRFQGDLTSAVGSAPPLDWVNSGQFFTNTLVDGVDRMALRFPEGSGLVLQPATVVFPSNQYTVVVLFQFDAVNGWRRLLDFKNGASWNGLYVVNGGLCFYPATAVSAVCVTNNAWHQLALTREPGGRVRVYCDGVERLSFNDWESSHTVIAAANTLRFFKDNGIEEASGWAARIRNFNSPLSAAQVAALDRVPGGAGGPVTLSAPRLGQDGIFRFNVTGPAGAVFRIEASTTLAAWGTVTNITGFTGSLECQVPAAGAPWRFFRAAP